MIRRITRHVREREDLALHYLVFRLDEYSLVFHAEEQESVYYTWTRALDTSSTWDDKGKLTEAFLFKLILSTQTAEEQLLHFIQRPDDAIDLLACSRSFLPINDWNIVRQHLITDETARKIQRVLWFLSSFPKLIPRDISCQLILPLLDYEDTLIRASVLKILYFLEDQELIKVVIDRSWTWNLDQDENWQEIHWGSLLFCKYATYLPYAKLRNRVHPKYLGYAVQCRGMIEEEIKKYSEDIQNILVHLGAEMPDLPSELPFLSIAASISEDNDILMVHRVKISENSSSQKISFLSREASWRGMDKGNLQEWEDITSPNSDEHRQQIRRQMVDKVFKQQTKIGNIWFAQRFFTNTLDQIICKYPDLLEQWFNTVFTKNSGRIQHFYLGYSFYEALCTALLKVNPEKGILLYWQLQQPGIKIDIRDECSNIKLLDYALFQAIPSENIKCAWREKLEACKTDSELLETAILAQYGRGHEWIWSVVNQGIESTIAIEKSLAITLLAFIQERKAFDYLNSLRENQPDTWIKDLLELSCQLWQQDKWAMHWFSHFLSTIDDVTAWASFRLFLQCVDSRFWHWRQQVETESFESNFLKERYKFLEDSLDTIKHRIGNNEKPLREKFLGHKILVDQTHPWMLNI